MAWLENTVIPTVAFKVRVASDLGQSNACEINPSIWGEISTDEIFSNKKVVVFSLPGAFTPTCSTYQLPGFEENAQNLNTSSFVKMPVSHFPFLFDRMLLYICDGFRNDSLGLYLHFGSHFGFHFGAFGL